MRNHLGGKWGHNHHFIRLKAFLGQEFGQGSVGTWRLALRLGRRGSWGDRGLAVLFLGDIFLYCAQ